MLLVLTVPIWLTELRVRQRETQSIEYAKYKDLLCGSKSFEVIAMGSSHALDGIDPRLIRIKNLSCYNAAFSGAAPSYNLEFYKKVIAGKVKPKVVIYGVNWFMFDEGRLNRKSSHDRKYLRLEDLLFTPFDMLYVTYVDKLYELLTLPAVATQRYFNGFAWSDAPFEFENPRRAYNYRYEVKKFTELLELMKSDRVTVVLVETPEIIVPEEESAVKGNNGMIARMARDYGIPFLNYNDELISDINQNKEYFRNRGHLRYGGAQKFSALLMRDINGLIDSGKISLE